MHHKTHTRIYKTWCNMKQRCYYPNDRKFEYYGGKGISICNEWLNDFMSFYDWSISHRYSDGLSIDRINGNGNYEPSNCRWITMLDQQSHKSNTRMATFQGHTQTLRKWAGDIGISYNTLWARMDRGWSAEKAITTPLGAQGVK